jgi:hypothetical protein
MFEGKRSTITNSITCFVVFKDANLHLDCAIVHIIIIQGVEGCLVGI